MLVFKKRFFILVTFVSIVIFSFLLIDFFQIKSKSNTVVVGSKNCTENQILAEIIANLIEKNTDIKVKRKLNLEGTLICFEALKSKDIDIYPEYSGSAIFAILKENISNTDDLLFKYLKKTFLEKFNIKWLNPFGFENKYVLCMQSKKAKKLDICNFSDLKNYTKTKKLNIAFDPEFSIRQEVVAIKNSYSLDLKHEIIDQSLLYFSVHSDVVDVTNGFSTDSKIEKYDLLILEDDKKALPSYIAAPLIRKEVLDKYPKIKTELKKLDGKITDEKIKKLIYLADEKKQKVYDVARTFLKAEKLI
ncbi:MAG: Carnitine transport binding protein OpuCC [Candidatus Anoxychlamydiales bacterium]|nr:Carnitine transport binding protein OpuCC [Candidatus Anoxychlamydiales bacterium]NGX40524.1 Carnitine transport binding protein OpuCC [Candidatus Anoxychlamydiales bacterium]